jgi:hypothetical protein
LDIIDDSNVVPNKQCKDWFLKWHAMPMTSAYFQIKMADRIFRFENLAEEWPRMASFIGLPDIPAVPHIGGGTSVDVRLSQHDKAMIYEYFKEDFETFGYAR